MENNALQVEIAATLRGLVEVPTLNRNCLRITPTFWSRCRSVPLTFDGERPPQILVDGFVGCCGWNSWKVYNDAIEHGLILWAGFALWHNRWVQHAWCMLGDRIVESTIVFRLYYGAAYSVSELDGFERNFAKLKSRDYTGKWINTWQDGRRAQLPFDALKHGPGICRERDWETGQIKEGLGRN